MLSSDLATLFTGRTYEIEMYPFSFSEFLSYYGITDIQAAFDRYIKEGGMSGSYLYKEPEKKNKYLTDLFDILILKDIRQKYKIRNIALMDKINHKTVGSYLDYLCNAFLIARTRHEQYQYECGVYGKISNDNEDNIPF